MEQRSENFYRDSRRIPLYPGIDLFYIDIRSDPFSLHHERFGHILQINYCRKGQLAWNTETGSSVYLNQGDFSVHTLDVCTDSSLDFPVGQYQGLTISIDLQKASAQPPELLAGTDLFDGLLQKKFHNDNAITFLAGKQQTESIFSAFYGQPEKLRFSYQRLKMLELLLYLAQVELALGNRLTEYRAEQIETVRRIHDQLLQHLEDRITIELLSKRYLIDPTTLKAAFKAVYGTSLAAHIKTHRMERAAQLLRETEDSVAKIASQVGYESQSKFTASFKQMFHTLPSEYRKRH